MVDADLYGRKGVCHIKLLLIFTVDIDLLVDGPFLSLDYLPGCLVVRGGTCVLMNLLATSFFIIVVSYVQC